MSQQNVERVVGRIVTDEGFRRSFAGDRPAALAQLQEEGLELNPCEQRALLGLDLEAVSQFAECLDPCIQKIDLGSKA